MSNLKKINTVTYLLEIWPKETTYRSLGLHFHQKRPRKSVKILFILTVIVEIHYVITVTEKMIRICIEEEGFLKLATRRKLFLTKKHILVRLNFAKKHINKPISFPKKAI
jgi:hypothetical protein